MSTQRDDKILVHVASPLKAVVEELARAEGRSVSNYVRNWLIAHCEQRLAERSDQAA